jgi:uncharacterized protein (DUF4415 family)
MAKRAFKQPALSMASKSSSPTLKSRTTRAASSARAKRRPKSAEPIGGKLRALSDDWETFKNLSDEEVRARAMSDPDARPLPASFWKNATVSVPAPKHLLSLRLDPDTLAWFKAQGKGYQTRINAVLRAYVKAHTR